MKRLEKVLGMMMKAAEKEFNKTGRRETVVKLSRKKYVITFSQYQKGNSLYVAGSNGHFVRYMEDHLMYNHELKDILVVIGTFTEKEWEKLFQQQEIKLSRTKIEPILEKERIREEMLNEQISQIMSKLQSKGSNRLKAEIDGREYYFNFNDGYYQIADDNGYVGYIRGRNGTIKQFDYLPYEDLIKSLGLLNDGDIDDWHRKQEFLLTPVTFEKPSFEQRIRLLLEKRNDYQILFRMFGDEKYQMRAERIKEVIARVSQKQKI